MSNAHLDLCTASMDMYCSFLIVYKLRVVVIYSQVLRIEFGTMTLRYSATILHNIENCHEIIKLSPTNWNQLLYCGLNRHGHQTIQRGCRAGAQTIRTVKCIVSTRKASSVNGGWYHQVAYAYKQRGVNTANLH